MNNNDFDHQLKAGAKLAGQLVQKKLMALIAPYLPIVIIAVAIFFLLLWLVGAVYSAFPSAGSQDQTPILAGVEKNVAQDAALKTEYINLANKYNVKDTWLINSNAVTPDDGDAYEFSPAHPHYPGQGVAVTGALSDPYGNDWRLRLMWGQIHAATLYYAYTNNLTEITPKLQEQVAKDLHPYFYYKKSQVIITTCDNNGCETTTSEQYLLVEAYTIQGHYQYHYRWETTVSDHGNTTITREVLQDTQQILPNKWQRLEDWMVANYQINSNSDDLVLARTAVLEAGSAFNQYKEWLDWLRYNNLDGVYLSSSSVPAELLSYFKEAEAAYGIPWWFLAAVAFKESSFNPQAENSVSGCYGLMQLSPGNWQYYSQLLGFDPQLDKDNPRAQIMCGAYMLAMDGLQRVDWSAADWQQQTLSTLTFYGGFRGANAEQRCEEEYASLIWTLANGFKGSANTTKWPLPANYGINSITSYFGEVSSVRDHVHQGIDIAVPVGTQVTSASTGRVTFAGWENSANHSQGYGLYVCVRDQNHLYFYGHLSALEVQVGQEVDIGAPIGKSGNTGSSTGPHLHFEIRDLTLGGNSGQAVDPLLLLNNNVNN